MAADIELVKTSPLLAGLKEETLEQFGECAEKVLFEPNVGVLAETESSDEIFLILEGNAQMRVVLSAPGNANDTLEMGPGDLFGAVRFFGESLPSGTFIANSKIIALRWQAADWRTICAADPESGYLLAMEIGKLVLQRVRAVSTDKLNAVSWGLGL